MLHLEERLKNEAKLKSMEKAGQAALEMAKKEDAPQEESPGDEKEVERFLQICRLRFA